MLQGEHCLWKEPQWLTLPMRIWRQSRIELTLP